MLNRAVGKALHHYEMISDGDRIAVGVSGFLNVFYAGEISTMVPNQSFSQGKFSVIRPLAFADEKTIRRYAGEKKFPVFTNPCPSAKTSKRRQIKELLKELYAGKKNQRKYFQGHALCQQRVPVKIEPPVQG